MRILTLIILLSSSSAFSESLSTLSNVAHHIFGDTNYFCHSEDKKSEIILSLKNHQADIVVWLEGQEDLIGGISVQEGFSLISASPLLITLPGDLIFAKVARTQGTVVDADNSVSDLKCALATTERVSTQVYRVNGEIFTNAEYKWPIRGRWTRLRQ
jgi:hypothetical protein